jgi:hypothetical protein
MAYKEKTCPTCGVTHKKRGAYCSRSCGNTRPMSDAQKESIAAAKREWHATSETAEIAAHNFISQGKNKDPDPIPPQKPIDLGVGRFVQDGDLWEEV